MWTVGAVTGAGVVQRGVLRGVRRAKHCCDRRQLEDTLEGSLVESGLVLKLLCNRHHNYSLTLFFYIVKLELSAILLSVIKLFKLGSIYI